jgi:ActR/RegA family two-component response regulator
MPREEPRQIGSCFPPATILIVEDDDAVLTMSRQALESAGFTVLTSSTGQSAIALLREPLDLAIVDFKLPDMSGIDVIRRTAGDSPRRFVLVSGFLTIEICVAAMKLGALEVIEKPVSIERLLAIVQACLGGAAADESSREHADATALPPMGGPPGSAAHRWAMYVRKACEAGGDLRTLDDWARCAGVSCSTLCESCRRIGIPPRAARDFIRALRAMRQSSVYRCDPCVLLEISDRRTLKLLLERAGPFFGSGSRTSVLQFVRHQRFVPASNEGVRVLLGHLEQW